ncbi:MAG: YjbQ family protein [Oscillospiraceae bacterium]|jgi:thiamine phosphate synthase YjbQ (UPF0047 family)|nr:YjbQ family protein [Oscillospiraceae bacterium]
MFYEYPIKTKADENHDITLSAREAVRKSGVRSGLCVVFSPHTTAGIAISDAAERVSPLSVGSSVTVFVESGQLVLDDRQSILFREFDVPQDRVYLIKVVSG